MAAIYSDNSLTIGRTPLVQLNRVSEGCGARVLAKIEGRNPLLGEVPHRCGDGGGGGTRRPAGPRQGAD